MKLIKYLGYLGFFLSILALLLFSKLVGVSWFFKITTILVSAGMLLISIWIIFRFEKVSVERKLLKNHNEINSFIKSADKVLVELSKCSVISGSCIAENEITHEHYIQNYDVLYNVRSSEEFRGNETVLVVNHLCQGSMKKYYSHLIFKDMNTVRFLMEEHQYGILYLDKKNCNRYYFSVPF